jgi:S1-C subfamily serine protease
MLHEFSERIADVVAAAAPSVVQVQGSRSPASGVVHGPGVVVTTMRAVGRENGLKVRSHDGHELSAELMGWDPATTIAVLAARGLDAPAATIAEHPAKVGQFVVPLARSWSNGVTASAGIVAIIGGPLRTGRRRSIEQVFRITAPMHEGFSGGAVLATSGGVLGIATASVIRGFAVVIPAPIAWKAAGLVIEHGHVKRGYLGLAGQPVTLTEQQRAAAGLEGGLLVVAVAAEGPAAGAGLLVGDVVVGIGDSPVEGPERLMDLLTAIEAGKEIVVRVLRGRALTEIHVTAGERPRK